MTFNVAIGVCSIDEKIVVSPSSNEMLGALVESDSGPLLSHWKEG